MYKLLAFISILIFILSCPASAAVKKWTIMVYGISEPDIEEGMLEDLLEMSEVGTNANLNMVFQLDFSNKYFSDKQKILGSGSCADMRRVEIRKNDFWLKKNLGEANSGDPALLTDFLEWL